MPTDDSEQERWTDEELASQIEMVLMTVGGGFGGREIRDRLLEAARRLRGGEEEREPPYCLDCGHPPAYHDGGHCAATRVVEETGEEFPCGCESDRHFLGRDALSPTDGEEGSLKSWRIHLADEVARAVERVEAQSCEVTIPVSDEAEIVVRTPRQPDTDEKEGLDPNDKVVLNCRECERMAVLPTDEDGYPNLSLKVPGWSHHPPDEWTCPDHSAAPDTEGREEPGMPDEIRGTPWRWRVCADCQYAYWALDYDHRVCNDCGSERVTDYVPDSARPEEAGGGDGVIDPCENHPDRMAVGHTMDGVGLCRECAPSPQEDTGGYTDEDLEWAFDILLPDKPPVEDIDKVRDYEEKRTALDCIRDRLRGAPEGAREPSLPFVIKERLLAARDAFVDSDWEEVGHQMYQIADFYADDPDNPWDSLRTGREERDDG